MTTENPLAKSDGQSLARKNNKLPKRELRAQIESQFGKLSEFTSWGQTMTHKAKIAEYRPEEGFLRFEGGYGATPDIFIDYVLLDPTQKTHARREISFREWKSGRELESITISYKEGELASECKFGYAVDGKEIHYIGGSIYHHTKGVSITSSDYFWAALGIFEVNYPSRINPLFKDICEVRLKTNIGSLEKELQVYKKGRRTFEYHDKQLQVIITKKESGDIERELFYSGGSTEFPFDMPFALEVTQPYLITVKDAGTAFRFIQTDSRNNADVTEFVFPQFPEADELDGILKGDKDIWPTILDKVPFKLIMRPLGVAPLSPPALD